MVRTRRAPRRNGRPRARKTTVGVLAAALVAVGAVAACDVSVEGPFGPTGTPAGTTAPAPGGVP
ncbi:hypothetical protein, partial [Corynebacterium bovis]